jgi:hypothetical protein
VGTCAVTPSASEPNPDAQTTFPSAGPAFTRFSLTLEPGLRSEAAGPLYSLQSTWDAPRDWTGALPDPNDPATVQSAVTTLALAPFFSRVDRPALEGRSWDLLYPLITYDRYGHEYRLQFGQLISFSGGRNQDDSDSRTLSLMPFYYHRRSNNPALDYTAVWPFYGHLQKRLFRDEIHWVLWPLYVQTTKADRVTDNYFAPFFHLRHGDGLRGWQLWPLLGLEHKDITTRTNRFGDLEQIPGYDSRFALWPFYFNNNVGIGSTNLVRQRVLLPFYSLQLSPAKDIRTYLWPFGPTFLDARSEGYHQIGAPWPFLVFARGPGKTTDRVFPIYSHTRTPTTDSQSALWPLYWHRETTSTNLFRTSTRVGLFLYYNGTDRDRAATNQPPRRRTDLWPLFASRQRPDGSTRLQLLAPVESLLGDNPSVARNWSPVWSIWRSEQNPKTGTSSHSLLWNLYRNERTPETRRVSFLFGLVQYHRGPEGSGWRWLHLFGPKPPPVRPPAARPPTPPAPTMPPTPPPPRPF